VAVTNTSELEWASQGLHEVSLCNRWQTSDGARWGDAQTILPCRVASGDSVDLLLTVKAPAEPGSYVMELDLVQSGVAWFADKGSQPAHVHVDVRGRPRQRDDAAFEPRIEMWGVPRDEVVEVVERSGGNVLDAQEDLFAGPGWIAFRYFVTKTAMVSPARA
jgi:hypothetical protein